MYVYRIQSTSIARGGKVVLEVGGEREGRWKNLTATKKSCSRDNGSNEIV